MQFIKALCKEGSKCLLTTLFLGFGIALFISCGLGSDPVSVFLDGMNRTFHIPASLTDQIISLALLLIALMINRSSIGINTILQTLLIGICVEIPMRMIAPLEFATKALWIRFLMIVIAQFCMAFSYAWMQTFQMGMGTLDANIYKISEFFPVTYVTVRVCYDASFLLLGGILGGVIGFGSVFSLATMGLFTYYIRKFIDAFMETRYLRMHLEERKENKYG